MRFDRRGRTMFLIPQEAAILEDVLRDARLTLVDPGEDADPQVTDRLFPDAYPDDPDASAQFRDLTADAAALRAERVERCRAQAQEALDSGHVDLRSPEVRADWIRAVNEVRLIMGTRLGVTGDHDEPDPADPLAQAFVVYHWLTAMQDGLVTAAMR